jgi:hypothetical protein
MATPPREDQSATAATTRCLPSFPKLDQIRIELVSPLHIVTLYSFTKFDTNWFSICGDITQAYVKFEVSMLNSSARQIHNLDQIRIKLGPSIGIGTLYQI